MPANKVVDDDKRRALGEGGLYQRANGLWVGTVDCGYDSEGKRVRKSVSSKDYRTAVEKLDALKRDVADNIEVDRTMTVAKWLDYWLVNIHKKRVRPSTYDDYVGVVQNIKNVLGKKRMVELKPKHVREMHTALGIGRRRTAKAHVVLNRALRDAVTEEVVRRNVAATVDPPATADNPRKPIPLALVHMILTEAFKTGDVMFAARWMAAFMTGARQGEVLGWEWDKVDLDKGAVDVSWQLQQLTLSHGCGDKLPTGKFPCGFARAFKCPDAKFDVNPNFEVRRLYAGLALTRPKSKAGRRWIPLIPAMVQALRVLKEKDCGPNPHGLVFHRPDGRPMDPKDDWEAWIDLCRRAEVIGEDETISLHRARNTAATLLRAGGADEQTRMEILGHSTPEVTRVYAAADEARNALTMGVLSVVLPKNSPEFVKPAEPVDAEVVEEE